MSWPDRLLIGFGVFVAVGLVEMAVWLFVCWLLGGPDDLEMPSRRGRLR